MDNIEEKVLGLLGIKKLVLPAMIIVIVMCFFILLFVGLISWAGLKKLDADAEYTVDVETDVVTYYPTSQSSPKIYLGVFKLLTNIRFAKSENCPTYETGESYDEGEIKFRDNAVVQLEKVGPDSIRIQIKHKNKIGEIAELTSKEGRCNIVDKFAAKMVLTPDSPRFVMNMVGGIEIGSKLSFSVDQYFPLLKGGEVVVMDKSFLTENPVQLPSVNLHRGDNVTLLNEVTSSNTGLISAELNVESLLGVFHKKGGQIEITKPYSSNPYPITTSFVDRITHDGELAMAMSITVFILGILGYLVTTLIRLSMFNDEDKNQQNSIPKEEAKKPIKEKSKNE